ncbi:lysophospholipid acyltransferase family protein [Azotobacter chroococcum]|uniref:lysophospholipid acyltransferase family protein n=1 Tax=Azotobacter chroococcum TaxID=353 RepID=UPI0010AE9F51|nr:lysophospholipid acyltransferase family protein [Azotobacter chroococcum]TKD38731.1 1-acyl-sn-glycerol-3-phosphate acyltransferase [Azotobacter chroococcum]
MNNPQIPPPGEDLPAASVPRSRPSPAQRLLAWPITGFARLLTGARSLWRGCAPEPKQRIYFANHSSHADFVLLWSSLPPALRARTRPVAGADYWQQGRLRPFLIHRVFHGVLVDRELHDRHSNPLQPLLDALAGGDSLIIFPEGTRNPSEGLLPFKSGLYRLARTCPQVELVPVWIANLNRVMPKGRVLPLPLLCTVTFGAPLTLGPGERKEAFLARARETLLNLAMEAD